MNSTAIIKNISLDYITKKTIITLQLDAANCAQSLAQLKDDKLSIEIKKWYKKRSLDANAYCWVMCEKIAKELSKEGITTKEEIYKDAILQVGSFEPMIVEEKAFENFKRI